jgi:hypothetical protein
MNLRFNLAAALALAAPVSALADVKINDSLSVGGYAAGSYRTTDTDPGTSTDKFDLDAVKTLFTGSFKPVTGVVSLFYQPGVPKDVTVLDAYATVDIGGGASVTAGKFLSYMGYEAFDIPNMTQISYANGDFLAPIPGYHSGVRLDFGDKDNAAGIALVDSVYSGPNYLKGDGELKHNAGIEAFYSYKGIKDVTLWFGIAHDTKGNVVHKNQAITIYDFWLSYAVSKDASLGLEYCAKNGGTGDKGYNWLLFYGYNFDAKWSSAFRLSGEKLSSGGPGFTKYTVSPSYKVNDNFFVRAEISYQDYTKFAANSATFFGLQSVFKF